MCRQGQGKERRDGKLQNSKIRQKTATINSLELKNVSKPTGTQECGQKALEIENTTKNSLKLENAAMNTLQLENAALLHTHSISILVIFVMNQTVFRYLFYLLARSYACRIVFNDKYWCLAVSGVTAKPRPTAALMLLKS